MDWMIYRDVSELCDFSELDYLVSLRNGFKNLLNLPKYSKLFKNFLNTEKDILFQDATYNLIVGLTHLYHIHPLVQNLIIFYYMSKEYEKKDVQLFFQQSLKEYMGFYLQHEPLEPDCLDLKTFISNSLNVLTDSVNTTVDYLINQFNKCHFSRKHLEKEYSETLSAFHLLDYHHKKVLNICCGNACGIQLVPCKMTCIDLNKYMGIHLLDTLNICHFIECNIFDKLFESLSSLFNVWIGIHTCRNLSIRIVETFIHFAPESSVLCLIPCCVLRRKHYTKLLTETIYKRIFKAYYVPIKNHPLRGLCSSAMHLEYLTNLCQDFKFKIKTCRNMKSDKNKALVVYK